MFCKLINYERLDMNNYEITFNHSIQRTPGSESFSTNSNSQGKMVVQAATNSQAENMVRSMFGGHNNCHINTSMRKF